MSLLDIKLETVARYVTLFRESRNQDHNTDVRRCDRPEVRKALKRLEPYPQIYKVCLSNKIVKLSY